MSEEKIRCYYCNGIISEDDWESPDKRIVVEFTPDSAFTTEETLIYHIGCEEK